MGDTPGSPTISTKLQRIAEQAACYPDMVFNNVYHLIDVDFLREAHRLTRKDAAPGVDKVTAKEYAVDLEQNLRDLHERLRFNRYVAPPGERVWIDKEGGKKRPISKACFEDKIVQRAVVMILQAIFDHDFHEFSHGFRKGHSQHQALQEVREKCMKLNIGWILDADVSGYFDSIDRSFLREFLLRRVSDGGITRLIGKWLNAGVMEAGTLTHPDKGTPQGGVISPMLSNIFLHYVLDEWYVQDVQPRLKGRSFLIRFADDFIIGFELEEDARRVMDVLPKRFSRFALTIHPEKTVLVEFKPPPHRDRSAGGKGTFDFLGFTHYWAKSRRGYWVIKRKTVGKRLRRFMKSIWHWCRENRHEYIAEQHLALCSKLRGYYQYYGIRGNIKMLEAVHEHTARAWRYWLSRRSQKSHISWQKFLGSLRKMPLPTPRIIHNI
ncbi:MAG: group II intron reverse transcriptase/maturase [Anaerolineaceae bacterium]|nr:group II intron reverse transcriptase/maturase [Anaerolineaceae bacterium]